MSIIFRVGQLIMLVMMTIWLLFGAGLTWVGMKAQSDIESSSRESSDAADYGSSSSESRHQYRERQHNEYERERRREREGVNIDTDSARPMVNLEPAR